MLYYTIIFGTKTCKYNRNHDIFVQRRSYPTPIRVVIPGRSRRQMIWIWRGHWPCTTYGNNLCNGFRIILANRPHTIKSWLVCFLSYQHYTINVYVFHAQKTARELRGKRAVVENLYVCNPYFYFPSMCGQMHIVELFVWGNVLPIRFVICVGWA